jgi:glycerophosphoryl diester phosphodiesterase
MSASAPTRAAPRTPDEPMPDPFNMTPGTSLPEIIAHRGNAVEFPENTLQSLASAVELGVRHLEFDVQLTADKMPVVLHDADLRRVGGRPDVVHEMPWAQFAETPVGEVSRFGNRFAFTYPPSLAQVLDALASWEGVTAYVEIKRASLNHFGRETVLRRIAQDVNRVIDRCVLISFDLPSLRIMRHMTGARIGWVVSDYGDATLTEAKSVAPEFLFANLERLPEGLQTLWPGPWDWAIYEVRNLKTARECQSLGARFVETMAVRSLRAAYEESRRQW